MSETGQATWPGVPAPDDSVLPFAVETLGVRGRLVRLGPMVTDILKRHSYPRAVAGLLTPYLPDTAGKLWAAFGSGANTPTPDEIASLGTAALAPGAAITSPGILYPRLELAEE